MTDMTDLTGHRYTASEWKLLLRVISKVLTIVHNDAHQYDLRDYMNIPAYSPVKIYNGLYELDTAWESTYSYELRVKNYMESVECIKNYVLNANDLFRDSAPNWERVTIVGPSQRRPLEVIEQYCDRFCDVVMLLRQADLLTQEELDLATLASGRLIIRDRQAIEDYFKQGE